MIDRIVKNYFLFFFSIIPISIIIGPSISLINILIIDISFIIYLIFNRNFSFIKNDAFKYLLLLYFYLIFNSFISADPNIGLSRNLGFIRIIVFFIAINYFFYDKSFFSKVLFSWFIFLLIVIIDVFFEYFNGENILGFGEIYGHRIVSFFKDEPIVGGYINAFYLILVGFLYDKSPKIYKNIILLFSVIIFISIFLTGERSNAIKAFLGFMLFYIFFKNYNIKQKLIFFILGLTILTFAVTNSVYFKNRYISQVKVSIFENQKYFDLYKSGFEIFKDNKVFGVGNKNYRIVACSKNLDEAEVSSKYVCNTHPHQTYFEFLSEHGIFGTLIILLVIYKILFSKFINFFRVLNYTQLGTFIYIFLIFIPFLPSGAFFSDYAVTLFALNLSIFYASNAKTNIFSR